MAKIGGILVPAEGPLDARIMLLGEAAGETEEKERRPFVGKAGNYLDRFILRKVPMHREGVRIANAVPYRCVDNKGKNAQPTIAQIRAHRAYVEEEIANTHPRVVLALGNTALHSLLPIYNGDEEEDEKKSTGVSGIGKWAGKVIWHRALGCWVIPTFHPSGLMREFYGDGTRQNRGGVLWKTSATIQHFKEAVRLSKHPFPKQVYPKGIVVETEKAAIAVLREMLKSPVVAADIETGSLARTSRFLGFSVANDGLVGYYVKRDLLTKPVLALFGELLASQKVTKLFHNGAFDGTYLELNGLPRLVNWLDTMLAASLVDENFPKGLKPLTWRYSNFGGYDQELEDYKRRDKIKSYEEIPDEILGPYGALDAPATFQLWEKFKPILEEEGTLEFFYKLMMPTRYVLNKVQANGFRVDKQKIDAILEMGEKAIVRLQEKIYEEAGGEFNARSTKQLQKVLFEEIGLRPVKKTATGYSCDEESLEALAKQKGGDIARYLLDIRYIHTVQDHFLLKVRQAIGKDERVRARYNSVGTVTGRTSVSDPPLHGVFRDRLVRTIFVPSPGKVLVVTDIKSAELRALAAYCRDPNLLRAFDEDRDLHVETYKLMFNKAADYVPTDEERQIGKTINFALIYRETVYGLAHQLGISVEQADAYLRLYFKKFPRVKRYMDETIAFCKEYGFVETLLGRRRHIPEANSDDPRVLSHAERQMINSRVQGLANDVTNIAMIRLDAWYARQNLDAILVHNVHDSIITEASEEDAPQVVELNKASIQMGVEGVDVKFDCDVDIERAWGEHKKDSKLEECFIRAGIIKLPKEKKAKVA